MGIQTFDLKEAADFLKISPRILSQRASKGEVPGAKLGKFWCFREDDLAEYIRSCYTKKNKRLARQRTFDLNELSIQTSD
jgi:excisionase family DNA binding protein